MPNLHPCAAYPAQDAALQEHLARLRPPPPGGEKGPDEVLPKRCLVALKLLPRDVAGMGVLDQHLPVFLRQRDDGVLRVRLAYCAMPAVDKRSGIARVMEDLHDPALIGRPEDHLSLPDTPVDATGKLEALSPKSLLDRGG